MSVDAQLLAILACPSCRSTLREDGDTLVCTGCALVYPVRDGIPVLLLDEATRPGQ